MVIGNLNNHAKTEHFCRYLVTLVRNNAINLSH